MLVSGKEFAKYLRLYKNIADIRKVYYNGYTMCKKNGEDMEIKDKMKELRESTGMNRKEFCEYFGIPYRTVTEWERGTRKMPDYVFRLLAYLLRSFYTLCIHYSILFLYLQYFCIVLNTWQTPFQTQAPPPHLFIRILLEPR